jgi:hypothetical protein
MRILGAAVLLSVTLVVGYALLGGRDYEPTPVADSCAPRARPATGDVLDPAQQATLAVLDGAACDLGTSREQVLIDLLRERNPERVSDDRLKAAVMKGIDRAEREDALDGSEASLLRLGVNLGGVQALIDQLRG